MDDGPLRLLPAAEAIGIPPAALRELADKGAVPCLRVGDSRFFDVRAVRRALLYLAGKVTARGGAG